MKLCSLKGAERVFIGLVPYPCDWVSYADNEVKRKRSNSLTAGELISR